jgi:heme-degrading monooxygenase HmoA
MSNIKPSVMLVVRGVGSNLSFEEFEKRYKERLPLFLEVPGLLQKYFSYDHVTKEWAGIYLWKSREALDAYLASDLRKSIASAYELTTPPTLEIYPIIKALKE